MSIDNIRPPNPNDYNNFQSDYKRYKKPFMYQGLGVGGSGKPAPYTPKTSLKHASVRAALKASQPKKEKRVVEYQGYFFTDEVDYELEEGEVPYSYTDIDLAYAEEDDGPPPLVSDDEGF